MIKRLLLLLALTVFPCLATTTQVIGTLVDAAGNPLNGVACFKLPVNAIDTSTHRALSPVQICFNVTNGILPVFANLTPNDVIQPANTYYQVTVKNSAKALIFNANYVIPTGAGTFDIGQAIPTTITTTSISFASPGLLNSTNTWTAPNNFQAAIFVGGTATFNSTVSFTGNSTIWAESNVAPASSPGTDACYGNAVNHALQCSYNGDAFSNMLRVVAAGQTAMPTTTVNAGTCGTAQITSTVGVTVNDVIAWSFNNTTVGAGVLFVQQAAGAGQVFFQYCNATAGNLTPGAATINWKVVR